MKSSEPFSVPVVDIGPSRAVGRPVGDVARRIEPVFVNPCWHTEVRCLPSAVSADRPARYEPMLAGEYLSSRFDDTYAYRRTSIV